ncbi:carboxymuconolactone decarboxylase family protein [Variovorax sp. J22R24]|uniref:carboxymuconolactone decarboxylase family protein n=1 Tax=Variovorax TaxID=34072 RepID=UPI0025752AE7|nr:MULTISPECIES: carboxymuconolactone decarboxylase family protein [unclassified Variovorax]MDM0054005.1 carboxymuconolactone decarboxylase family protein [Variovorax sp. J22R115]MDM0106535.1 carboxymuconolactone decarboxylase family protein [Variovorax sp. J22R24]
MNTESPTRSPALSHGATPICDQMRASGNWNPLWNEFAAMDPVWTEKFMTMSAHSKSSGRLDAKTIEFIAIAVDASCTHLYAPGVRRHIRRALQLGATKEEILCVLEYVSVLGLHSMSLGAPILAEEMLAAAAHADTD